MSSYFLGVILGSILQPSALVALILSLILGKKRSKITLIIVIMVCFLQFIAIGGGTLGAFSLIIPMIVGIIIIILVSTFRK